MKRDYIGHSWQSCGAMRFRFSEGRADGTKAIMVRNACGLHLTLLDDRCLDIYQLDIKGTNVPYLTKNGPVHPAYYDASEWEWLRSFAAGFLTTCGLTQAGEPCRFNGAQWGLHGPASCLAAENVSISEDEEAICITGVVRQYKFQTEHLLLERCIKVYKNENRLSIYDTVRNEGWKESPLMLLYHFNFGFPLLNENSWIVLPETDIEGWDEYSQSMIDDHLKMSPPDAGWKEQTFIHKLKGKCQKSGLMVADNYQVPKLAVAFMYDCENLSYLTQWKHFKPGEYVMALEPCNNHVKGAAWEQENGSLVTMRPGETRQMHLDIRFMESADEISRMALLIKNM